MLRLRAAGKTTESFSLLVCALCFVCVWGLAQPTSAVALENLPDAPQSRIREDTPETRQQTESSIVGAVFDTARDVVPGAIVTLISSDKPEVTIASGPDGKFAFPNLPAGNYTVRISLQGARPYTSPEITLERGQEYELTGIALVFTSENVSVLVSGSTLGIAEEELHLQLQQRLLGVVPNFYTSYIWNAAPLTPRLKFLLALRSMVDPAVFLTTAAGAGIGQATNRTPAFGQGASGYAKRFGAGYADEVSNRLFSGAIYASLFHQDPRFFYQGAGSKKSRALYAVTRAVVTRGDDGRDEPNYSRILGAFTAAALNTAYRPGSERSVGGAFRRGSITLGSYSADSLFREFVFRRITEKVPGKYKRTP
jgi:hypothetical protein